MRVSGRVNALRAAATADDHSEGTCRQAKSSQRTTFTAALRTFGNGGRNGHAADYLHSTARLRSSSFATQQPAWRQEDRRQGREVRQGRFHSAAEGTFARRSYRRSSRDARVRRTEVSAPDRRFYG